jgi:hypothetical protein
MNYWRQHDSDDGNNLLPETSESLLKRRTSYMLNLALLALITTLVASACYYYYYYTHVLSSVVPPSQPIGAYTLLECQEGQDFFHTNYAFFSGPDSAGSAGYNTYVSRERAQVLGIVNVSMEVDYLLDDAILYDKDDGTQQADDVKGRQQHGSRRQQERGTDGGSTSKKAPPPVLRPFVYINSGPTNAGPRESIRLEGSRRFNRGLFIIDIRHMPAGCGVWPAFWLTDEAHWPVNGEIDIVEGVNYQTQAKTALHSTNGCSMENDIPFGVMTGNWDTAQGIPDAQTGVPDMTMRYAKNCFVYDPQQWLNQGCVAMSDRNDTLGRPLNENGGGVFVLEWDPLNRHIRSWVFSPHADVPENIVQAIRTAHLSEHDRVVPNPETWPLPYGFFAIGQDTDCPASHFRNMRLVFNTAFCGSVAGNRFQMDCPLQAKDFATCNDYIQSEPEELEEAYWKIRGVYVYERQWEKRWIN